MLAQIRADLEGAFATFEKTTKVPCVWDNLQPDRSYLEYIRPTIAFAPTNLEIGFDEQNVKTGTVIVQIFTQAGRGLYRSYEIADFVNTFIEYKKFPNGTSTLSSSLRHIGVDSGFYQSNLISPFQFYK